MVDTDKENLVSKDLPLYEQKRWGFSFKDSQRDFLERRSRSIHNVPVFYPPHNTPECMGPGRHYHTYNTDQLVIFYYGWCPFDQGQLGRKLQIQTQIPLVDRQQNRGFHHITNRETLTYRLENEFIPRSRDLSKEIEFYVDTHKNLSNIL